MNYTSGVKRLLQTATGSQDFVLSITKGLTNPSKGPFRYNYYNILLSTDDGVYGIDGVLDKKAWVLQDCFENCDVCTNTLEFCTSCGLDRKTGKISYFFENNKCVSTCKTGFFGNGAYQC